MVAEKSLICTDACSSWGADFCLLSAGRSSAKIDTPTITFRVLKPVGILVHLLTKNLLVCGCNTTILPPVWPVILTNTSTSYPSLRILDRMRASTVLVTPSLSCFARASVLTIEHPSLRLVHNPHSSQTVVSSPVLLALLTAAFACMTPLAGYRRGTTATSLSAEPRWRMASQRGIHKTGPQDRRV